MIKINKAPEYEDWFYSLTLKEQLQIDSRLERISNFEYFGDVKNIGNGIAELRWKNGWRVYFIKQLSKIILLLNGGIKNDQKKDIKRAQILIKKYARN